MGGTGGTCGFWTPPLGLGLGLYLQNRGGHALGHGAVHHGEAVPQRCVQVPLRHLSEQPHPSRPETGAGTALCRRASWGGRGRTVVLQTAPYGDEGLSPSPPPMSRRHCELCLPGIRGQTEGAGHFF